MKFHLADKSMSQYKSRSDEEDQATKNSQNVVKGPKKAVDKIIKTTTHQALPQTDK
jgi:hypothetical protein